MHHFENFNKTLNISAPSTGLEDNLYQASYSNLKGSGDSLSQGNVLVGQSQFIDCSPLEEFDRANNQSSFDLESVLKDGCQSVTVTRDSKGELKSVEFNIEKESCSIRRSDDGKSWISEPPLGKGKKIEDVKVEKNGTVIVEMSEGKIKGKMIRHCDGTFEAKFESA